MITQTDLRLINGLIARVTKNIGITRYEKYAIQEELKDKYGVQLDTPIPSPYSEVHDGA